MPTFRITWLNRMLRRLLKARRGEVRAMEDALHLENVLRFAGLFMGTILFPTALLTWFGLAGVEDGPERVAADVQREATVAADTFWAQAERRFSTFEERVRDRLEAGRSPVESARELHPHLLVALRSDEEGNLRAPFIREDDVAEGIAELGLHPAVEAARRMERDGVAPERVAQAYAAAAAALPSPAARGRALLDEARMLAKAGRTEEVDARLQIVSSRYRGLRDPWGFPLEELARLEQARRTMEQDPRAGQAALRTLVNDLLAERWIVGQGGEAAIARHALSLVRQEGQTDWVSTTRERVAERTTSLYWATTLLPELDQVGRASAAIRVADGDLLWRTGSRALWATIHWDGRRYDFGLDYEAIVSELKADARASAVADADVIAWLLGPGEAPPPTVLAAKSLAPWLNGWQVVVAVRDPAALAETQRSERRRRIIIIGVALLMIVFGTLATVQLIKRELDIARMQTSFAANVSHELRSPITHIRIQGESLMLGLSDTEEEREEAYVSIVRESERLSRLVDNVLDFAAIEQGAKRYTLRDRDLVGTVLRAVDSISSAQELTDKELDVDLPANFPDVPHDGDAVAQCVINLVSNAAKYSEPGGWIGVRGRRVESGVEITVSDKGIGIAPHDLRRLFDPFFRSRDALARRRKGTGIGLTITRYIMRSHGGDVQVASRPGKGSTFTLRFPLEEPAA